MGNQPLSTQIEDNWSFQQISQDEYQEEKEVKRYRHPPVRLPAPESTT